ncbi:MAG TPA: HD domain-containing phosphohydrolase [Paucimonas sp.]|nr:HD domain-containing phosphohydrolase [Paucimonas sp.]
MDIQESSAAAPRTVTAYLEIIGDDAVQSRMFPLRDEVVIGRERQDSLEADKFLLVPVHTVSRRHARIQRRDDAFLVEDLHSFNGTFVGAERLLPGAWRPLHDGDELRVSSVQMVFHSLVAPARDNITTIVTRSFDATELSARFDPGAATATDIARGDMQRTVQKLHAMAQVSIALGVVKDRATLTDKIMNFIFELFPAAERAFILLKTGEEEAPVTARRRDGAAVDPQRAGMSRTIVADVLNNKRSILSLDTLSDRHFGAQASIIAQAIRSVMCVPLLVDGECLGLIQVDTSSEARAFQEADLEILSGVCAEAAVALKSFQLYSDIERLLDGFVRASVQAIEERDPVTAGHSFRVANYAERLAIAVDRADTPDLRQVVFTPDQLREIRYAALLHDFGKVGVREHVLRKEKKLHHFEMRMLEQRFRHARACLERKAYRQLVDLHLRHDLSMAAFREEKRKIDEGLRQEFERLECFFEAIRQANEPAISHGAAAPDLGPAAEYVFQDADGAVSRLLDAAEIGALRLPKGCLTPDERRQIEAHVADSYSFLILIPWTQDLAGVPSIAHGHHEKLDGSGYPMGLRGEQISVQTRILTICDIFDALTAGDRPYKSALPTERALDLIAAECRAGHLDARLFDVFAEARIWS